jgi:hypothetical protein
MLPNTAEYCGTTCGILRNIAALLAEYCGILRHYLRNTAELLRNIAELLLLLSAAAMRNIAAYLDALKMLSSLESSRLSSACGFVTR